MGNITKAKIAKELGLSYLRTLAELESEELRNELDVMFYTLLDTYVDSALADPIWSLLNQDKDEDELEELLENLPDKEDIPFLH